MIQLTARSANLADIKTVLEDQRARRLDVVVNAAAVSMVDGMLTFSEPVDHITDDGVEKVAGSFRPTDFFDEGAADKLKLPSRFLKDMRGERVDIYDSLINARLHGGLSACAPAPDFTYAGHAGKLLLRLLVGDDGTPGVARALLSSKYRRMDNLDVLVAMLTGIRQAGTPVSIDECDLTERKMYIRLRAPEVAALAPKLLDGYRSQFDGPGGISRAAERQAGMQMRVDRQGGGWDVPRALAAASREGMGYAPGSEPVVWAGLVISNSDVGGGAFTIAPQIRVKICKNGLTVLADAHRKVHLGGEHEIGVVDKSVETQEAELKLITAQTVDAVKAFLSPQWLAEAVERIEALAGSPVVGGKPSISEVAKAVGFTQGEADDIFELFLRGGQMTAGGVVNAVTAFAQTLDNADRQDEMERLSMKVLERAAKAG
jgi:hypothetical protein